MVELYRAMEWHKKAQKIQQQIAQTKPIPNKEAEK